MIQKLHYFFIILSLIFTFNLSAQETTYEETVSYCGTEMQEQGLGGSTSIELGCAAYFPQLSDYTGNEISTIRIGFVGRASNVYVFVSESLDEEPIYRQRISGASEGWNDVALSTPVQLDGSPLYVGYTCTVPGGEFSIGMSTLDPCENSFFLDQSNGYEDVSSQYSPLALQVVVSGDNFTINAASITHVQHSFIDEQAAGETIPSVITVANDGAETISSLTVLYNIEGTENTADFEGLDIPRYGSSNITVNLPSQSAGTHDVSYTITSVNGKDNEAETSTYVAAKRVHIMTETFPRTIVCEEFSGNLCGYCPAGIVAMEQLVEKYPDNFIAIVAHYYNSNDPMYISEYSPIISFGRTAPNFVINRSKVTDQAFPEDGTASGRNLVEDLLLSEWKEKVCGTIQITADKETISNNRLEVNVSASFNLDMADSPFEICLVAVENGLSGGEYYQLNNYSGGSIEMGGWEKLPNIVTDIVYNDAAIALVDFYGIDGSLPADVTSGETYEYTHEMNLYRAKNIDNVVVVALLVNTETGEIINAGKYALNTTSGIQDAASGNNEYVIVGNRHGIKILSGAAAPRTYKLYSTNGIIVNTTQSAATNVTLEQPGPGIYILQIEERNKQMHTQKIIIN